MPVNIVPSAFTSPEDVYIFRGAKMYAQLYSTPPLKNPDPTTGFYWGFTTTGSPQPPPVYYLGCVNDISLSFNFDRQEVKCDTTGTVALAVRATSLELSATSSSMVPVPFFALLLDQDQSGIIVDTTNGVEYLGIGSKANNLWHMLLYNEEANVALWFHKCQIEPGTITFGADLWKVSFKATVLAVDSYPSEQRFGVIIRNTQ